MKSVKKSGINPALKQIALEKLVSICPICQAKQDNLQTSIISQNPQAEYIHIRCASCQGSLVALIFSTGPLISSIGLISDLSQQDARRFQHIKSISEDDVIALHELFRQPKVVQQLLNAD